MNILSIKIVWKSKMSLENTLIIIGLIVFPNIGGWLGSIVVLKNMKWLNQCVKKPSFYPPTFVFPIAWTLLYCGMGYASYLVYDELRPISNGFNRTALIAVALYLLQLVLNWLWCPIFFGYHSFSWVCNKIQLHFFLFNYHFIKK